MRVFEDHKPQKTLHYRLSFFQHVPQHVCESTRHQATHDRWPGRQPSCLDGEDIFVAPEVAEEAELSQELARALLVFETRDLLNRHLFSVLTVLCCHNNAIAALP